MHGVYLRGTPMHRLFIDRNNMHTIGHGDDHQNQGSNDRDAIE